MSLHADQCQLSMIPLHPGDDWVQVWRASLQSSTQELADFYSTLSADEKARAERFYFERDRDYFITGRGLLRRLLGDYLGMDPAWIEFCYGAHGKPELKIQRQEKPLHINLSHSKDLAVYAFCWGRLVGIDVEFIRPMPDEDGFARHFFSPAEQAWIGALSGVQKRDAFFKIWTCKEAFFKANGMGLDTPIQRAEIALGEAQTARLASVGGDVEEAARWRLEFFEPAPGYQAALALAEPV